MTYYQKLFNEATRMCVTNRCFDASFEAFETARRVYTAGNVQQAVAALNPEQQHGEQVAEQGEEEHGMEN